jgi:hypothetical protein
MRKVIRFVLASAAWTYTIAHFAASGVKQPLGNFYGDFLASFPSWRLSVLLGRLDLYKGSLAEKWALEFGVGHPLWHYGPVEHLVTLPLFAFSDLRSAYTAWLIVNYAFLLAILALAAAVFQGNRSKWVWRSASAIAILNYGPLYEALTQRTIEIFELLLIFAGFALMKRGNLTISGFAIGLAAMTKFLPLVFVPYFVVKRRWQAFAGSMMAIGPIAIVTEVVFRWRYSGTVVQLREGGFLNSALNQSLSGMIIRLLVWTKSSLSAATLSRGAIIVGLVGLSWLFLRARNCATIEDLEWSTLIVAMVLLPPHNEQYYFVLLLFPYLAVVARELRPVAPAHAARRWWLAISFFLTGTLVPLSVLNRLTGANVFSTYLTWGIPFVGAAILATVCVHAVLAEGAAAHDTTPDSGMPRAV